jgi:decaprenylphospho-beta-D-erythro-pentofuranosid-2-ulose 2-reductase
LLGLLTSSNQSTKFVKSNFEIKQELDEACNTIASFEQIDFAIVAVGFLPSENCELDSLLVQKAMQVNGLAVPVLLSALVNRMKDQTSGRILYISSVASVRPRLRNFTYGCSKRAADFFAEGLMHKYNGEKLKISILRPGYVHTRMSKDFRPAPFAISAEAVGRITIEGIRKDKNIIYAPSFLKFMMFVLRLIPQKYFDKINR